MSTKVELVKELYDEPSLKQLKHEKKEEADRAKTIQKLAAQLRFTDKSYAQQAKEMGAKSYSLSKRKQRLSSLVERLKCGGRFKNLMAAFIIFLAPKAWLYEYLRK